ncbi:MAG: glycosyltransferase, partial [Actinomycetota bacterium]|nr:glycosyltransferase [Actinomycetota bacterium]
PPGVPAFDGVDWFWLPTIAQAAVFLLRRRPSVLVLQWWTGAALHTYLALASVARLRRARIVVEFHEALDTGEARIGLVGRYVRAVMPLLLGKVDGAVVHSRFDLELIRKSYALGGKAIRVIPHPPYSHYRSEEAAREAPPDACNFFYFGVIRPFKGVEDLVRAFDSIPPGEIERYWLTIVGETWENWTLPQELIARSRYRDRITFVNRYVSDEEADALFGGADVVVLPYHRSSQSGPLHIALHLGLPVVTTRVGGLVEAVEGFEGAFLSEPRNGDSLLAAMRAAAGVAGERFQTGRDWHSTSLAYRAFLREIASKDRPERLAIGRGRLAGRAGRGRRAGAER